MKRGTKRRALLGSALFFSAFACNSVFALNSSTVETTINMDVEPIITVSFSSSVAVLKASLKEQLDEIKVGAEIRTNSRTGYKAYLSTDKKRKSNEDVLATSLVHIVNDEKTIPTLEQTVSSANFPVNHWGYSIDGGENYSGMKAMNDVDLADFTSSNASENRNMDLYFATKLDNVQANGYYENTIIVTAVANYVAQTINDIQYMQDINDEIALGMREEQQYQLKDKRDNKKYWVSKLKDGNIWMTQNLDYAVFEDDAKTKFVLTTELSDVWTDVEYPSRYVGIDDVGTNTDLDYYNEINYDVGRDSDIIAVYENIAFYPEKGVFYHLATGDLADEELKHYYAGTKYPYELMKFSKLDGKTYDKSPGHNSEQNPIASAYDKVIPNYFQSVCPKGWRLPSSSEYETLPQYYGVYKGNSLQSFVESAAYPMVVQGDSGRGGYKTIFVDASNTPNFSNGRKIRMAKYTYGNMLNGNKTEDYYSFNDGSNKDPDDDENYYDTDHHSFVRCVMRW